MSTMYEIEHLLAEGKLNPIYMDEDYRELQISIIPTMSLTQILHRYSIGKLELSEEQLEALISDIDTLKHHNIWDVDTEQQTIKQSIEAIEEAEAYKMLSASDKAKYDAEFIKQFEM